MPARLFDVAVDRMQGLLNQVNWVAMELVPDGFLLEWFDKVC
jgi:hypothetical protein